MTALKKPNPFLAERWMVGITAPERHLIESIRAGCMLGPDLYDPEFVAGLLSPDGGATLESLARQRAQWEEAWGLLLAATRAVIAPEAGQ